MSPAFLVRYGLMHAIGRFPAEPALAGLRRGDAVVLRSIRGTELGTVLEAAEPGPAPADPDPPRVLRTATAADRLAAERSARLRPARFERCRGLFEGGRWPLVLIDVEPLLDPDRTVLYYLGPPCLDDEGLRRAVHDSGLDLLLEPVGPPAEPDPPSGCGSCGSGGSGCRSSSDSGCSSCPVSHLARPRPLP